MLYLFEIMQELLYNASNNFRKWCEGYWDSKRYIQQTAKPLARFW